MKDKDHTVEYTSIDYHSMCQKSKERIKNCLLYTSPSPRDRTRSRMPSSA